jgi:hypothetical protein
MFYWCGRVCADMLDEPGKVLSLSQVQQKISHGHSLLRSLRVEYSVRYTMGQKKIVLERQILAKQPCWLIHESTKRYDADRSGLAVDGQKAFINNTSELVYFPLQRTFYQKGIDPAEGLPGSLKIEFFAMATGHLSLDAFKPTRPFGHAYLLADIAHSDHFTIRPRLELQRGRWCHVLVSNDESDILWLDVDRGCTLLRREVYNPADGQQIVCFTSGSHKEVAPEIWLPGWFRQVRFKFNSVLPEQRSDVFATAKAEVTRYEVNSLKANDLRFEAPRGAIELDALSLAPKSFYPGGSEHLLAVGDWMTEFVAVRQSAQFAGFRVLVNALAIALGAACGRAIILIGRAWVDVRSRGTLTELKLARESQATNVFQ